MKVFGLLLGVGLVTVIAWLNIPSEEDRIVGQLRDFTKAVSVGPDTAPIEIAAREQKLLTYVAEDAQIDLGMPFSPIHRRGALNVLFDEPSVDGGIAVNFLDATINFDRRLLLASGRLRVFIETNEKNYGMRVFDVALRQVQDSWLLTDLRVVVPTEQQIKQ